MLRLCKCKTLPKSKTTKVKKILIYLEASIKDRPYVLMTVKQFRETYCAAYKQDPLTSWGAKKLTKKLIDMLVGNKRHVGRASENQSECLNQELTKI